MPVRVKCEKCKKTLSVKDHLAGKKIRCPVCQNPVAVPAAGVPQPAAAPAVKKPVATGKLAPPKKPGADPVKTNGAPPVKPKSNGVPHKPAEPIEIPPENVEEAALSALADEPKKAANDDGPKTIDFRCSWCDEEVHLPIELAGKQAPCPNPECKRIIKVPLPKVAEKKDWRKMDRRGPAAALVSQPEALDDAWGTQEATQARQASLQQAGVIADPKKKPLGVTGWLRRGFIAACVVGLLLFIAFGASKMLSSNKHVNAISELNKLVTDNDPKIKLPLLRAEARRTIGLLRLRSNDPKAITDAKSAFDAAQALADFTLATDKPAINEQLFLIELAIDQIELGGSEAEASSKKRLDWEDVNKSLSATLTRIKTLDVRVLALRQVCTRLIEKGQMPMAMQMAGQFSNADLETKMRPVPYRQQIALLYCCNKLDNLKDLKPPAPGIKEMQDDHARVGFAEGYVRKDEFNEAFELVKLKGPAMHRVDASLGAATVALEQRKKKDEAHKFFKEAVKIAQENKLTLSSWQQLELVKLATRLDDSAAATKLMETMDPPFKLRAQLEIFLAVCEKSSDRVNADDLKDLEANDKDGTTLGLAWLALARHNARHGATRDANQRTFDDRIAAVTLPAEIVENLRPMVEVGTHLGSMK